MATARNVAAWSEMVTVALQVRSSSCYELHATTGVGMSFRHPKQNQKRHPVRFAECTVTASRVISLNMVNSEYRLGTSRQCCQQSSAANNRKGHCTSTRMSGTAVNWYHHHHDIRRTDKHDTVTIGQIIHTNKNGSEFNSSNRPNINQVNTEQ